MDAVNNSLIKGTMLISNQFGIVNHVSKLPRLNYDPKLVSFGIWPSNTLAFGAEKYEGRSSGCNFDLQKSFMGTLGETVERYCPVFYNKENMILSSYKNLKVHTLYRPRNMPCSMRSNMPRKIILSIGSTRISNYIGINAWILLMGKKPGFPEHASIFPGHVKSNG